VVGDTSILSAEKNVDQKIKFLVIYHLWRYWQGITPSESVKVRHSPLASENWTITWKRCKIGGKLLLITNRKSCMSFRLVPKSVTLNYLERRNGCSMRYFTEFRIFAGALRISAWLQIYRHKVTENKCIMHRRSWVASK